MKRGRFLLVLFVGFALTCAMAETKGKTATAVKPKCDTAKVDTSKITFHKIVKQTKEGIDSMGRSVDKSTERFRKDGKQAIVNAKKETKNAAKAVKDFFKKE